MNKCNNYQDSFTRKEWLQTWNTNCSNFCCELVMSFEHLWYISIFFIIHPGLWCPLRNEFNDHLTEKMVKCILDDVHIIQNWWCTCSREFSTCHQIFSQNSLHQVYPGFILGEGILAPVARPWMRACHLAVCFSSHHNTSKTFKSTGPARLGGDKVFVVAL